METVPRPQQDSLLSLLFFMLYSTLRFKAWNKHQESEVYLPPTNVSRVNILTDGLKRRNKWEIIGKATYSWQAKIMHEELCSSKVLGPSPCLLATHDNEGLEFLSWKVLSIHVLITRHNKHHSHASTHKWKALDLPIVETTVPAKKKELLKSQLLSSNCDSFPTGYTPFWMASIRFWERKQSLVLLWLLFSSACCKNTTSLAPFLRVPLTSLQRQSDTIHTFTSKAGKPLSSGFEYSTCALFVLTAPVGVWRETVSLSVTKDLVSLRPSSLENHDPVGD